MPALVIEFGRCGVGIARAGGMRMLSLGVVCLAWCDASMAAQLRQVNAALTAAREALEAVVSRHRDIPASLAESVTSPPVGAPGRAGLLPANTALDVSSRAYAPAGESLAGADFRRGDV